MRISTAVSLTLALFCTIRAIGSSGTTSEDKPLLAVSSNKFGGWDIITCDVDGKNAKRLTEDPKGAMEPAWSPDGSKIAFVSYRTGVGQIFVMDADGKNQVNLTQTGDHERSPAWSPDGKKILFVSSRNGNQEIFVMNVDGSDPKNLTNHAAFDADPAWSPDGKLIIFASNRLGGFYVWVMNADGSEPRRLVDKHLLGWLYPGWSHDGKQILFSGRTDEGSIALFSANADGTAIQQLTDAGGWNTFSAWSPDGRYVAYAHFDEAPLGFGDGGGTEASGAGGELMIMDTIEGTKTKLPAGELPMWGPKPAWRPIKR